MAKSRATLILVLHALVLVCGFGVLVDRAETSLQLVMTILTAIVAIFTWVSAFVPIMKMGDGELTMCPMVISVAPAMYAVGGAASGVLWVLELSAEAVVIGCVAILVAAAGAIAIVIANSTTGVSSDRPAVLLWVPPRTQVLRVAVGAFVEAQSKTSIQVLAIGAHVLGLVAFVVELTLLAVLWLVVEVGFSVLEVPFRVALRLAGRSTTYTMRFMTILAGGTAVAALSAGLVVGAMSLVEYQGVV